MGADDAGAPTAKRRGNSTRHTERGQTLILFVAIFSVILAMGAVALDQGLAYGRHGVAQNRADAASRAGAYACLGALSEGQPVSSACDGAPEAAAVANAVANMADAADVAPTPSPDCPDVGDDMPSMEVVVQRDSPSLFSKAFGQDGFTARAIATSCLGTVREIQSGAMDMIPVWFTRPPTIGSDPNKNYCGDPPGQGHTIAGEVCVIYSASNDLDSAGLFRRGSGNTTCGPTNDAGILDAIEAGLGTYTCVVDQTIRDESVNDDDVLDAFQARLEQTDECSASPTTRTAFGATMQALGTAAQDGPDFTFAGSNDADADDDWTVYQARGCFSPRLALIPLVNQTFSGNKTIVGFTAVYILGCYEDDDPRSATTTTNKCRPADRGQGNHDTEVRAGIVRIYVPGSAVQDIQEIDTSGSDGWVGTAASLAIQTTR